MGFLRDVSAYFCACALLLAFLFNGSFAVGEAAALLAFYVAYVGAAVITSRCTLGSPALDAHGRLALGDALMDAGAAGMQS